MAEKISTQTNQVLKLFPHPVLKFMKTHYRNVRFRKALIQGRRSFREYGHLYPKRILFVAGLPKSGTTWLESMLGAFPGYTIIPDPQATLWDYKHGGTHNFQLSMNYFHAIENTLSLVKIHCSGSRNNVELLKRLKIPYVILYRDLRDAAVSHFYYVKRTKWHPEFPVYEHMDVSTGLKHFAKTLLPAWRDWVLDWKENRDTATSMVVRYEDLLEDTLNVFRDMVHLYGLPDTNVEKIVNEHQFSEMSKKGDFFRKGVAGDWENQFTDEIKDLFKEKIGDFLVQEGYEKDLNW